MMAWSVATVSAPTLCQSGLKQRLYLSNQRLERERPTADAGRNLFRRLALSVREQLPHHPRPGARIPEPVDVESRRQLLVEHRLELPRPEIARRIVSRI